MAIWTVLLAACVSETSFQERYAATMCDRYAECYAEDYTALYGDDVDSCILAWNEHGGAAACLDTCIYDASAASSCLYMTGDETCDVVFGSGVTECTGVYDCSTPEYQDCITAS